MPSQSLTWTRSPAWPSFSSLQSPLLIVLRAVASTSSPVLMNSLSCPVSTLFFLLMNFLGTLTPATTSSSSSSSSSPESRGDWRGE